MLAITSPSNIHREEQFSYADNNFSEIINDLEKITNSVSVERLFHKRDQDIICNVIDKLRYVRSLIHDLNMHKEQGADIEFDFRNHTFKITDLIGNTEGHPHNLSIVSCCEALEVISDAIDYYHRGSHPQRLGFIARLLTGVRQ